MGKLCDKLDLVTYVCACTAKLLSKGIGSNALLSLSVKSATRSISFSSLASSAADPAYELELTEFEKLGAWIEAVGECKLTSSSSSREPWCGGGALGDRGSEWWWWGCLLGNA